MNSTLDSLKLKLNRTILLGILGVWFGLTALQAQVDSTFVESRPTIIGLNLDYGFLIKHSENLRQIDDAYPYGIGIDWSKLLLTQKAWEFCNCFPRVGINMAYWNWDNPEVLGSGIFALGYLEPYFNTHRRLNIFVRMGLGGAYLSNPYDETDNPLNLSYSTHLSFALMVGVGLNYRINPSWNLQLAAKYNHTSNGGVSTPNKGLNFPSLSLGVNKSLTDVVFPYLEKIGKRQPPNDKTRLSLVHFSGWSNASVGDKDKFYVFGFMGKFSRWIRGRSALTGATEWIFDYSRREHIKLEGIDKSFATGSILLGHEFWLGRVTFSQELGVYYFNDYRINDDVYQRYGLNYHFGKSFFAGFNLKAHRHVADFIDLRVGYVF